MLGIQNRASRIARGFRKDKRGATMVEFALIAFPFFALVGSILETGLVLMSRQALDEAASTAGRALMTGQISSGGATPAQQEQKFKDILCKNASWFISCSNILYDVRAYSAFSSADLTQPVSNNTFNPTGLPRFQPGGAGQIVVVRAYYMRKIYADYIGSNLGYLSGGYHLIIGTSVFKSEG